VDDKTVELLRHNPAKAAGEAQLNDTAAWDSAQLNAES
jgi:hypothetical protein